MKLFHLHEKRNQFSGYDCGYEVSGEFNRIKENFLFIKIPEFTSQIYI